MKCPYCKSENVVEGKLNAGQGFYFEEENSKWYESKESKVMATACMNCGKIFDLRLKDVKKIKDQPKGLID